MLLFLTRKVGAALSLVVVVASITFFMLYASGSDPVANLLGQSATAAQIETRRAELGLDRPVLTQFLEWWGHLLRGDLGTSWTNRQPVMATLLTRVPVTLSLAIAATVVAAVVGTALGTLAARFRGVVDVVLQLVVVVGFALPAFWFAVLLSQTFAIRLGWFPAVGYTPLVESPAAWLSSITLPVVALAAGVTASIAQQVRNSVIEVERRDFVRALRSRGIGPGRILVAHTLRNAAPAALTVLSLQFIGLLGGAIIIENIYALPGIGALAISATNVGDVPVVMGIVLVTVVIVVVVNLVLDLLQGLLNPKARTR
ncbi:ABC transporter permease [Nocardioides bruguierae]|uniref:ABC transporter permease n=1 Tax=Nocardioides bruguierae TaxID=2945102 RepID=A0A9X2D8Q1_9ACTN|nr:ABC transporter permease [Nocardioides bruguierae]MCM0621390.1 ABC transporter permease [Nocardioides bruguierae]